MNEIELYKEKFVRLIEETKLQGIKVFAYENKIENKDIVIETGLALISTHIDQNNEYIPLWKLGDTIE